MKVKRVYLEAQGPLTLAHVTKLQDTLHCTVVAKSKNFLARICKFKRASLNMLGMSPKKEKGIFHLSADPKPKMEKQKNDIRAKKQILYDMVLKQLTDDLS